MKNHTAIITGASQGIGKAIALHLSQQGMIVGLLARNEEKLQEVAEQCPNPSHIMAIDIKDVQKVQEHLMDFKQKWGKIDVLVNNAGVSYRANVQEADLKKWNDIIDTNLTSVVAITQFVLPDMLQAKQGAIINIASIASKISYAGGSAYCASKHALLGFTNALFEEVREHKIKVCAICPGFVNTELVASKNLDMTKMIQPEDIAQCVDFILNFPSTGCPTEITIRPQESPYL